MTGGTEELLCRGSKGGGMTGGTEEPLLTIVGVVVLDKPCVVCTGSRPPPDGSVVPPRSWTELFCSTVVVTVVVDRMELRGLALVNPDKPGKLGELREPEELETDNRKLELLAIDNGKLKLALELVELKADGLDELDELEEVDELEELDKLEELEELELELVELDDVEEDELNVELGARLGFTTVLVAY